jgi:S-adenosylmethionine decarboxylase
LHGNGYRLGPVTGDHLFVFVADHTKRRKALEVDTDPVLNIMMFDIDEQFAQNLYYGSYLTSENEPLAAVAVDDDNNDNNSDQTRQSRTNGLHSSPVSRRHHHMDARVFEPCGYSMNSILFRSYTTIHITPGKATGSYSFENEPKGSKVTNRSLPMCSGLFNRNVSC